MEQPSNLVFEGKDSVCILLWQPIANFLHPITSKFYKGIEIKKRKNAQFYSLIYSALTTNRNLFFTFGIYSDAKNLHSDFTKNTFVHANGCNALIMLNVKASTKRRNKHLRYIVSMEKPISTEPLLDGTYTIIFKAIYITGHTQNNN